MASFFRYRIAEKVIPFLTRNGANESLMWPSVVSTFVKINREKGEQPQLFIPWKRITNLYQTNDFENPTELVRRLRNQGLPTAEGFVDIALSQSPLGVVFTVDKHVFSKIVLAEICTSDENYPRNSCYFQEIPQKNVLVECKVPNIAEAFQMTHFRSAIHCNFIANINKIVGHNVTKVKHVADLGLKYAMILTGYQQFGLRDELLKNPSRHLSEVAKAAKLQYSNDVSFMNKVDLCLKKIEEGDLKTVSEWLDLKNICFKQHDDIFKTIGLTFDDSHFDSSYSSEIKETAKDLLKQNLISIQDDGKVSFNIPSEVKTENSYHNNKDTVFNLCRSIVSAVQTKERHNFDILYYVAPSSEQNFYSVLFPLMKKLGFQWSECLRHVRLKNISHFEGKGKVKVEVVNILQQAKMDLLDKLKINLQMEIGNDVEQMAEALGYASLCIYDMKHKRNVDYAVNWEEILSFERNSGISLQLCHAGLKGVQSDSEFIFNIEIDTSPLLQKCAHDLIQHLARFDEIVYKSYLTLEPCFLLEYLFSLWYFTNRATDVLKLDIQKDRLIVLKARLMLLSATLKVLQKGLLLLGITPYETNYSPPAFLKS